MSQGVRKLACAALGWCSALLLAHYLLPVPALLYCAALLAAASLLGLALRGNARLRALILCLSAACGCAWYWGYDALFQAPARALDGQGSFIFARVTGYPVVREDYSSVELRLDSEGLPHAAAVLCSYDDELEGMRPGDLIRANVKLMDASLRRGEETDSYTSRGVRLRGYFRSAPVVTGRWEYAFLYFPKTMARAVGEAAGSAFPEDVSAFMRAMLIGDTAELYADNETYSALKAAGVLHIVSVSGMHMSFLYGLIRRLSGSKRRAAAVAVPALWLFALMVGMSPSVVRSAFMLTLAMAAPFLKREGDGLTSLCAALILITAVNPVSVADAGLQLSFSAMAGIILVTPRVYDWCALLWKKPKKGSGTVRRLVIAGFSSSIGAIAISTPISALHFGYVSLISPLTNLLVLWAVSAAFIGGFCAVALWLVFPAAGAAAGYLAAWPARYTLFTARTLSKLPFAAVYTADKLVVWWLAFTYAVFAFAWLRRGKKPFRPIAPLCASVIALCAVASTSMLISRSECSVTALDVGQGQSIVVACGGDTVMVDCGGTGEKNAGDTAADYLLSRGRSRVALLVLTHLHEDHAGGVARLMSRVEVDCLMLPRDMSDDDSLLSEVLEAAEEQGTEVVFVSAGQDVALEGASLRVWPPLEAGDANERGLIALVSVGSYDLLITGDANKTVERALVETGELPDGELLIVGHHGSKYSTSKELLEAFTPETAVISVGYNNYGHPTPEALELLWEYGAEIYRTDLSGNVTVRID